jgi:hypothetical protein
MRNVRVLISRKKSMSDKSNSYPVNLLETAFPAQGFALGNAFGLRNQVFAALQNPGALVNAVEGALLTRGASPGNNVRLGDNILGEGISPSNSLPTGNLLVGQIPQINTNLETSNIFGSGPSGPPPLTSNNVFG